MSQTSTKNKRIAKNTLLLYVRQMFVMLVTLYTSRVILSALGITDYGVYNVVGGIVVMLGYLSGAMASATQRYISFGLGKGDPLQLQKVFSTTLQIHALIAAIVVLLAETAGLWLFYNKMQIPADRMMAAFIVFQCSIFTMILSVMSVPYESVIIAHEKMSAFAYISIVEVSLKLGVALAITWYWADKLILYAVLQLLVYVVIRFCYSIYCQRHFAESKYKRVYDRALMKEMLGFAGWNLFGSVAAAVNTQGVNILLNIYFGPVVNAARGIAVQVNGAANQFCANFMMALNPSITKSYAAGNYGETTVLMKRGALFSYYMLLMVCLPLFLEATTVLNLWLVEVPKDTDTYLRIMLFCILLWASSVPMITVANSTGKIGKLNVVHSIIVTSALPATWVLLDFGFPAETAFIAILAFEIISQVVRMFILKKLFPYYSIRDFCVDVYVRAAAVTLVSALLPVGLYAALPDTVLNAVFVCVVAILSVCATVFLIGLTAHERVFIKNVVRAKILKM